MTQTNKAESALTLIKKEILYMKATGIVRRIEARVIITQKCDKPL